MQRNSDRRHFWWSLYPTSCFSDHYGRYSLNKKPNQRSLNTRSLCSTKKGPSRRFWSLKPDWPLYPQSQNPMLTVLVIFFLYCQHISSFIFCCLACFINLLTSVLKANFLQSLKHSDISKLWRNGGSTFLAVFEWLESLP